MRTPEIRGIRFFVVHGPQFLEKGSSVFFGALLFKTSESLYIDIGLFGRLYRWVLAEWWK